jgi:hypothetical protein
MHRLALGCSLKTSKRHTADNIDRCRHMRTVPAVCVRKRHFRCDAVNAHDVAFASLTTSLMSDLNNGSIVTRGLSTVLGKCFKLRVLSNQRCRFITIHKLLTKIKIVILLNFHLRVPYSVL